VSARVPVGIEVRHRSGCPTPSGGTCRCEPSYRAWLVAGPRRRKVQKTFRTLKEAVEWREAMKVDLRRGTVNAPRTSTVEEAARRWLAGARSGAIRNRSGEEYKPSVIRGYEQVLRDYLLPALGRRRLSDLRRADVQEFVDELIAEGMGASTVRNAIMPLRVICRRAMARGDIHVNPTMGLELPAMRGRRERIASPAEGAALIAALEQRDRPLWATAMYAGLRRGELQALRWGDVDLERGVIRVERSWDPVAGPIEPKSRAGRRVVPMAQVLRRHLDPGEPDALAFGRTPASPVDATSLGQRADRAWKAAGLDRITLHECRHTFASLLIAAGANPKAVQTYMGHASITITLDLYGHLLPGSELEVAGLLNAYLDKSLRGTPWGTRGERRSGFERSQAVSSGREPGRLFDLGDP
jgi:integrase